MDVNQSNTSTLPIELEIGGLTKEDLIKKVLDAGFQIERNTLSFITQHDFPCTFVKKNVRLAYKTAVEMGLGEEPTYAEVQTWVKENGVLCDKDLALWLRLAYPDQPLAEWVAVMSESTPERYDGDPCTLHVINSEHSGKNVSYCYFRSHHRMRSGRVFCYMER